MNKLKFGIIGYGQAGAMHVRAAKTLRIADFVGVFTRSQLNPGIGIKQFSNLEEMVNAVDAVIIALPNYLHLNFAKQALDAYKHVLIEKPLGLDFLLAKEILKESENKSLLIGSVSQFYFTPGILFLEELLNQGSLGDIISINWEVYIRRDKEYFSESDWKSDPGKTGGGILMNFGSHIIDITIRLFGKQKILFSKMRNVREYSPLEDNLTAIMENSKGVLCTLNLNSASNTTFPIRCFVQGTRGNLALENFRVVCCDVASNIKPPKGAYNPILAFQNQLENFIFAIKSGISATAYSSSALETIRTIIMIQNVKPIRALKSVSIIDTISVPSKVILEVNQECNYICKTCDREWDKPNDKKDLKELIKALPSNIESIYITGGEPLLLNNIVEICRQIIEKGIKISLQTNASIPSRIAELCLAGVHSFNISIDGPENTHDSIRQKGSFDKVVESMKIIRSHGKSIVTTTVLCRYNLICADQVINELKRIGLRPDYMIFELAREYSRKQKHLSSKISGIDIRDFLFKTKKTRRRSYTLEALKTCISKIKTRAKACKFKIGFFPNDLDQIEDALFSYRKREKFKVFCTQIQIPRLTSTGDIVPCFYIRKSFGNILNGSVKDIWFSKELSKFKRNLIVNNYLPCCDNCFGLNRIG
jgi:predicted dehydrogenase/MoaA/NifB/PqqE/SkfB family radical SAM enzyme